MDKVFKIFGFVIPIATIIIAYFLVTKFDLRSVTTENDFITAILHSDSVYQLSNQAKTLIGVALSALGFCFGLLSFGIGIVLTRLDRLNRL
ncbi:MAG: hypothetical protein WBP29_01460 [Candidatus Zixiibacteriota bacterium]